MQVVQAPRASTILFNLVESSRNRHPWLLPANICPIVPITLLKAGVAFEFVDISPHTLHMDLEQARARLARARCGGVLYSHSYGEESTPEAFFRDTKHRHPEVMVVDDRCLCVPGIALRETAADATLYSTGYSKVVDFGFGGFAFIGDLTKYRARRLPFDPRDLEEVKASYKRAIDARTPYDYRDSHWLETDTPMAGWDEYARRIEAALEPSLSHRALLNDVYAKRLPADSQLPRSYQTWRFNARLENRQRALEAVFAAGLFASSHYACLSGIFAGGLAPHAAALGDEAINLFNDHRFTVEMAERACEAILKACA